MIESTIGKISSLLKTGKTPPSKTEEYFVQDYNWYTPGDIGKTKFLEKSERGVSEKAIQDKKAFLYPKSTLLITCIGNIGRIGIAKEKSASNQQITAIKPIEEIDVDFLYYWFYKNQKLISEKANNAVVPILNNKSLKEISISYPPLKTQKKIASILDDAQALKQKTEQLLKEYDELAQSIFLDMFGDPVTNPKGWEKVSFKKLFEQGKKSIKPKDLVKGQKYIGLEHIEKETGEILDFVNLKENEVKSNKYWFNENYVLYGKLRPYLNKVATPKFEGVCSTDIIPFKPRKDKSNIPFLVNLLRGKWFLNYANENTSGANLPRISPSMINKFETINPPTSLQNQFAEKIKLIEQQKELAKQELKESEDLFQALLQKAFKGELV